MPWSERAELVTRPGWHPSLDPPHAAGPPFAMGPAIHDVRCRGCAAFPIAGTRRRCLLCLDADFCASCARLHDHAAFIELHHPVHEEWGQTFALLTALPALVGADASPRDDDEDEHHDDSPFFLPGPDPASPPSPAGLAAPPPRGLHERLRAFLVSGAEGLARGGNPNWMNHAERGLSPVHVAAEHGRVDMVRLLKRVMACADPAGEAPVGPAAPTDLSGRTPLGWAVTSRSAAARRNEKDLELELFSPGDGSVCGVPTPAVDRAGCFGRHWRGENDGSITSVPLGPRVLGRGV